MQWSTLKNGYLLEVAELHGFDLLITADRRLRYQQNLSKRKIAVVELSTNHWLSIKRKLVDIGDAVIRAQPGSYEIVLCPSIANTKGNRERR